MKRTPPFKPPLEHEVIEYARQIGSPGMDAGHFLDYWEMRGWDVRPGIRMKSWKAAVRTWLRNKREWAAASGTPAAAPLSGADVRAIDDYTRQALAIIRERRGENIGRLYRKITDNYGAAVAESVRVAVARHKSEGTTP